MKPPILSIVIPWCDRPEIERTLHDNLAVLVGHEIEVVVVACGGDAQALGAAVQRAMSRSERCAPVRIIELPDTRFNKALALNLGVHMARCDTLFFLDTDIILQEDFLDGAVAEIAAGAAVIVDRVHESRPAPTQRYPELVEIVHSIELAARNGRRIRLETNRRRLDENSRSAPGLLVCARQHFIAVDGMNSDLEGWGWEDLDLLARLQFALDVPLRRLGRVVHLSHGDDRRAFEGHSRAANEARNFAMCMVNYGLGHYLGTYGDDVATWARRVIERTITA